MDAGSQQKLSQVNAELAARVGQFAAVLQSRGVTVRVVSGYRTYQQQAALYANRANNRNPVAVPGTSKHESGLAVDLSFSGSLGLNQIGPIGESLGLRWGGRFSRPDPGHFELAAGAVNQPEHVATDYEDSPVNYFESSVDYLEQSSTPPALLIAVAAVVAVALALDF